MADDHASLVNALSKYKLYETLSDFRTYAIGFFVVGFDTKSSKKWRRRVDI